MLFADFSFFCTIHENNQTVKGQIRKILQNVLNIYQFYYCYQIYQTVFALHF